MNGVFLVSSPSFTLILQRWLFFSREVNDESGLGGLEYGKMGLRDLSKRS